jgi:hypothetical protein
VVKRLSLDCKATVKLGEYSRGGKTRALLKAADHDMGDVQKSTPLGIVDEDSARLHLIFGTSAKTSDFLIDGLETYWAALPQHERERIDHLQLKVDNGPESSGVRTQFLHRLVAFVDRIGIPVQLLYYPPYHSKYNPIERCWGILEQHWNGALLSDLDTLLAWAGTMTWKGLRPVVELNRTLYHKGVRVSKKAMQTIEARLERNPDLPKWDVLIRPLQNG